jgi:GNAT superfamily N-acetyltransferase
MTTLEIRRARPGDGPAIAQIHREFADYYVDLAPNDFRRPDEAGLVAYCEPAVHQGEDDAIQLIAVLETEVVGVVSALIVPPHNDAGYQINPSLGETQLHIDYVATSTSHRRTGVGTMLVAAAEEWGRARGATVASTTTYVDSPLSMPFWQRRMRYTARSVNLIKQLA